MSVGDSFRPKGSVETLWPLGSLSIDNLVHHLVEVPILALNGSVGLEVVPRNPDVVDAVLLPEFVNSSYVRCAVVGDKICYCSVSTENILIDEVH